MLFDIATTIIVPTALVIIAAIFLGRRTAVAGGDSDSDSVSFAGGVISALFTVVLAFYIVFAWQLGADIGGNSDTESNAVIDVYHQADGLAPAQRDTVQAMLRSYADRVAGVEWGLLAQGRADPVPGQILRALREQFTALPADDNIGQSIRDNALADLRQVDESHRSRVDLATNGDTFNTVLLAGTILGAALMIAFPLLVGVSARPANIVIMALLTLVIGATVFLSIQLTHPLDGLFGTRPDAFREALTQMQPSL